MSRAARIAGEIEKQAASALDPAHSPAPETGITSTPSPVSNMGKRDATKATATRTGAAAAPPRSPRTETGIDTDEGEPEPNIFL